MITRRNAQHDRIMRSSVSSSRDLLKWKWTLDTVILESFRLARLELLATSIPTTSHLFAEVFSKIAKGGDVKLAIIINHATVDCFCVPLGSLILEQIDVLSTCSSSSGLRAGECSKSSGWWCSSFGNEITESSKFSWTVQTQLMRPQESDFKIIASTF